MHCIPVIVTVFRLCSTSSGSSGMSRRWPSASHRELLRILCAQPRGPLPTRMDLLSPIASPALALPSRPSDDSTVQCGSRRLRIALDCTMARTMTGRRVNNVQMFTVFRSVVRKFAIFHKFHCSLFINDYKSWENFGFFIKMNNNEFYLLVKNSLYYFNKCLFSSFNLLLVQ